MAIDSNVQKKRRSIRFAPDPGTLAEIIFEAEGIHIYGLVINESKGGCAVLLATDKNISDGMNCTCKVGNLAWTDADVRWIKALERNIFELGLHYHL